MVKMFFVVFFATGLAMIFFSWLMMQVVAEFEKRGILKK